MKSNLKSKIKSGKIKTFPSGGEVTGLLRYTRNDAERSNILTKGLNVVCQYASKLLETAESGVDKVVSSCEKNPSIHLRYMNFLRQRKTALDAPLHVVSSGRSMIEMLGVLAIIAVLSVGGIAGYSKAMEKFKVNKLMAEYNDLIFGLLEYRQSFQENIKGEPNLTNSIIALNLVPSTWIKLNDMYLQDSLGNWVNIRYRQSNGGYSDFEKGGVIIDFNLGGLNIDDEGNKSSDNFNEKICFEMLNNIIQPLHQTIYGLLMVGGSGRYYGDTYCQSNQSCLKNMTLTQMQQVCKSCNRSNRCNVTIIF